MAWADKYRKLELEQMLIPQEMQKSRELGAEGIGLCRTEHMFFEEEELQKLEK